VTKKVLPPRDMAWFDPLTGRPTDIFYEYMASIDQRVFKQPVSVTTPADTEVMIYSSTTGTWEPGAN
jgi:hypothetical protein